MASCFDCDDKNATVMPGTEGWFLYCNRCSKGWTIDSRGVRQDPRRSERGSADDAPPRGSERFDGNTGGGGFS